jgi:hypothetical protein
MKSERRSVKTSMMTVFALLVVVGAQAVARPVTEIEKLESETLACIEPSRRERLRKRLQEFVSHEASKDYRTAFLYLSERYKGLHTIRLTAEGYEDVRKAMPIVRFQVQSCTYAPDFNTYELWGCGEYDQFGPNPTFESVMGAEFYDNDWYFTPVFTREPCMHCEPRGCRIKDSSGKRT